ncbi:unnamed protein product [Brugia timori]|uniref:Uncharacterized protein n=1 Tax=Brugia timori TaxID=42155 RepID=A0A0R3QUZ9_9BILA|nr:unnamed protein product [Brugia timori]
MFEKTFLIFLLTVPVVIVESKQYEIKEFENPAKALPYKEVRKSHESEILKGIVHYVAVALFLRLLHPKGD